MVSFDQCAPRLYNIPVKLSWIEAFKRVDSSMNVRLVSATNLGKIVSNISPIFFSKATYLRPKVVGGPNRSEGSSSAFRSRVGGEMKKKEIDGCFAI